MVAREIVAARKRLADAVAQARKARYALESGKPGRGTLGKTAHGVLHRVLRQTAMFVPQEEHRQAEAELGRLRDLLP